MDKVIQLGHWDYLTSDALPAGEEVAAEKMLAAEVCAVLHARRS